MEIGEMEDIVINNFCIGEWENFSYPEEAVICLRNLAEYHPCRLLSIKFNLDTKMKYLHFILPYIAKLFKIDRKKLIEEYTKEYLYYDCFYEKKKKYTKFNRFEIMDI